MEKGGEEGTETQSPTDTTKAEDSTTDVPSGSKPAPKDSAYEEGKEAPKEKAKEKRQRKRYSYEMKLFEKYDLSEVKVRDAGLSRHINLSPIVIPHTGGRWANRSFGKTKMNIVERLINNMMRTEVFTGKKMKAYKVVRSAFEIIEQKTNRNPVQVLVDALEKAAPREEITRLKFGGISVPRAVDISPSRRLDMALRYISQGAVQSSFKNPKPIEQCLADEIMLASRGDMNSSAVAKKEEMERVAASAR